MNIKRKKQQQIQALLDEQVVTYLDIAINFGLISSVVLQVFYLIGDADTVRFRYVGIAASLCLVSLFNAQIIDLMCATNSSKPARMH